MPNAQWCHRRSLLLALTASLLSAPASAQDRPRAADPKVQPPASQPTKTGPLDPPAPGEAAPPGGAQAPAPEVPTASPVLDMVAVDALIAKLDDPSLMEREVAMTSIRNMPGISVRAVEEMMRRSSLSPEQRVRLSQVGQVVFMGEPRAAMGVRFAGLADDEEGQVQINEPTQGWDSARVLRPWDIIRSIDGQRIRSQGEARAAIVSYDPGDSVTVEIIRNGQPGTVRLRLGNFADLGNQSYLDRATLEAAWRLRSARLSGERAKPLMVDVPEGQWASDAAPRGNPNIERMNHPITSEPLRTQMRAIPVSDLAASGPSRASGQRESGSANEAAYSGERVRPTRVFPGNRRNAGLPPEIARMMLDSSRRQRASLNQQIASIRQLAADPNADPARAELLRRQAEALSRLVAQLDEEIAQQQRDAGDR